MFLFFHTGPQLSAVLFPLTFTNPDLFSPVFSVWTGLIYGCHLHQIKQMSVLFLAITWTKWMSPDVIFYQPFLTLRTLLCCLFVFFYRIYVLPFCTSHQMFFFFISLLCRRCGRCSWAPGLLWLTCSWPCPLSTLSWSSTMISTSHRLLSRNL